MWNLWNFHLFLNLKFFIKNPKINSLAIAKDSYQDLVEHEIDLPQKKAQEEF